MGKIGAGIWELGLKKKAECLCCVMFFLLKVHASPPKKIDCPVLLSTE